MRLALLMLVVCLIGCSSSPSSDKQAKAKELAPPPPLHFTPTNTSDPLAKYIELVGFRINEKGPGHLEVQFGVVNHSEADVGDLKMTVNIGSSAAKPGEAPLITFPVTVAKLGPLELKNVSVEVPTKMRIYELPDWQFLTANCQISEAQ